MPKTGVTGADGSMKRLLVQFSEAVFLAQPPPSDMHKFADEYFTRLWNRARLDMPAIGTSVRVIDPVEDKPERIGRVVAVNRIGNSLDVMYPDGTREGGVPREYTSTDTAPLDLSGHGHKSAAELQRELARPVPGFRALLVAFVVNVAKLEHPPGDVRKYAAEYFRTLREVNARAQQAMLQQTQARAAETEDAPEPAADNSNAKSISELAASYSPYRRVDTRPISPEVAAKLEKTQHSWFVEENAKISTAKFRAWARDTAEGAECLRVATRHYAAEQAARVREVRVRRETPQMPLCVNLGSVAVPPAFKAIKKLSFLRVDDCFEADAFGSRGPVELAGVAKGDVIVALNGRPVVSYAAFMSEVAKHAEFTLDVFTPAAELDEVTLDLATKHVYGVVHADSLSVAHVLFEWQKVQKADAEAARGLERHIIDLQRKFRDGTLARASRK